MTRPTSSTAGLLGVLVLAAGSVWAAEAATRVPEPVKAVEPADDVPYDATGKRDPFRPPRLSAKAGYGEPRTPLQRYEIGQLRLVAIIYETQEPRAVVEDEQGLGYIVKVGTPIGPNDGQVKAIERGRVLIQEDSVDYYGDRRAAEVVMELRTAERTAERGKR